MKIVLATYGSRGDVQPMLALSLALQSKGHAVLLAAPPEKANWAHQLGCPFYPLGRDLTAYIDKLHKVHSIRTLIYSVPFLRKEIKTQFALLPDLTSHADLLIGSSLVGALPSIAEAGKIPYRYIAFTPQMLPSRHHPHPAFSCQHLPELCNRMTWIAAKFMDFFNSTLLINRYRKQMGLPLICDTWRYILGRHVIVASDTAIAEVPEDVRSPKFTQTGYMHLAQPKQKSTPLERFIANGAPPIYAGFGSMPKLDQMDSLAIIVKAARSAGQRVIIGKFWDAPSPYDNCDDVFFVGKYPHRDLFARMAAVIHHGGAGTTATAAICGVPQIIVPHLLDQYYWGHRIHRTGLGPKPILRSKLSISKLAEAIETCRSDQRIPHKAKNIARSIKAQDGLEATVKAILDSLKAPEKRFVLE